MWRPLVLLALVMAMAVRVFVPSALAAPSPVSTTCSLAYIPDANERLAVATRGTDLVLVGDVVLETQVEAAYDKSGRYTGLVPTKHPIQDPKTEDAYFQSKVRPAVVLHGDAPAGDITLPWLNSLSPGCIGGPRLRVGERVLLLLSWTPTGMSPGGPVDFI